MSAPVDGKYRKSGAGLKGTSIVFAGREPFRDVRDFFRLNSAIFCGVAMNLSLSQVR